LHGMEKMTTFQLLGDAYQWPFNESFLSQEAEAFLETWTR
jgi:hypothetical protein